MRVLVITPPDPVLAADDVRAHLSNVPDEDEFLDGLIAAATGNIDGPAGWLGRSLGVQLLEARLDGFDNLGMPLTLPCGPVIAVQSTTYLDTTGASQTVVASSYELLGDDLEPVFGVNWPTPRLGRETVRIRYWAGYADDPTDPASGARLPAPIRAALLLMIGDFYSNRETTVDARAAAAVPIPMSTTVESLLGPYRLWR